MKRIRRRGRPTGPSKELSRRCFWHSAPTLSGRAEPIKFSPETRRGGELARCGAPARAPVFFLTRSLTRCRHSRRAARREARASKGAARGRGASIYVVLKGRPSSRPQKRAWPKLPIQRLFQRGAPSPPPFPSTMRAQILVVALARAAAAARPFLNEPDTGFEQVPDQQASGSLPNLTDIKGLPDFDLVARQYLPVTNYTYYRSGAAGEWSYRNNPEVFRRYRLRPRVMRDISRVESSLRCGPAPKPPPSWLCARPARPPLTAPSSQDRDIQPHLLGPLLHQRLREGGARPCRRRAEHGQGRRRGGHSLHGRTLPAFAWPLFSLTLCIRSSNPSSRPRAWRRLSRPRRRGRSSSCR